MADEDRDAAKAASMRAAQAKADAVRDRDMLAEALRSAEAVEDRLRASEAALGARSALFFAGVPWEAMPARTATAPYVPELRGPADTSNFSYADLRTSGGGGGDGPEDGGARHHAAWEAF